MKLGRLGLELTLGFLLLTGIFVGAGWLTLQHMSGMERQLDAILGTYWGKVQLANEALRYSSRNNRITMQMFLLDKRQAIGPLLAERAKNSDAISELLDEIQTRCDTEEEKRLFGKLWATRKPYVDSYKEALALLLKQGEYEKARLQMVNVTLPRLLDYHAAWEQYVRFESDQMKKAGSTAKARFHIERQRLLGLIGAGGVLTILIWLLLTIRLLRRDGDRLEAEKSSESTVATAYSV
jgi:hypothetical protein